MTHVAIIGGGPGGYEAAHVAAQLGAQVTLIEREGLGGSTVLTDCVPSKTLIATSDVLVDVSESSQLGIDVAGRVSADLAAVNARVLALAAAQSHDIEQRVLRDDVRIIIGTATLSGPQTVSVVPVGGEPESLTADVILLATGAHPRVVPSAAPDGERILTWEQVYGLPELPEHLIVVGSGVTGAEFASAYRALGAEVTLVSSRDQVLPGEDADAADVLEDVFVRRGVNILSRSRMDSVVRTDHGVRVTLTDGRAIDGSHCLLALGSVPNTEGIGLENVGVSRDSAGFIEVDGVSRTSVRGVYAAGDCTGVLMLASVAGMQGRIAMWHALGDAVSPLDLDRVASNVFTSPEIATVGVSQARVDSGDFVAETVMLPLSGNARAKMQGVSDGFVKLFARPGSGIVVGGVVVGPRASELVHAVTLAVSNALSVDQIAQTFTIYPSVSGSIAEAARRLHRRH